MAFIRIFPLPETSPLAAEAFGQGEPARCLAQGGPGKKEYYLNVAHINAFEEIPLYIVLENDPNNLMDGVRIRLADGSMLVVADDSETEEKKFVKILQQAMNTGIAGMEESQFGK